MGNPIDPFYSVVWSNIIKYFIGQILSKFALAATGPIGWLISSIILKFTDALYKAVVMFVDVGAIKLKNAVHQAQWQAASDNLTIILAEKGSDSPEFKDAHEKERESFYATFTFKADPIGANQSSSGA